MSSLSNPKRIDELIDKAAVSLGHEAYFECERMGVKALSMARQQHDFERMIRIVELLLDSRQQRVKRALRCSKVTVFNEPITESTKVNPGCYLVQPPQVGADARRLRLSAFQNDVAVAVLCREPITQYKLCPVVAICPGTTIRTKVQPPKSLEKPGIKWFAGALEALGEAAVEGIDPGIDVIRRIDAVIERLDALPEHTGLHETLVAFCHEAIEQRIAEPSNGDSSSTSSMGKKKRKLQS
jgi:hypothetical protein